MKIQPAYLTTILIAFVVSGGAAAQSRTSMQQRIARAKASTVRILVGGNPSGTGFVVAENLVATDFHVVQTLSAAPNGQTKVEYASKIEVQLPDGRVLAVTPHPSVLGNGLQEAIGKDVALLV